MVTAKKKILNKATANAVHGKNAAPDPIGPIGRASTATQLSAAEISVGGVMFKKKKVVTVPVLKLMPGAPAYVRIDSPMEISKQIENKGKGTETDASGAKKKKMEPATIAHVTDLIAKCEAIIILGTVLQGVLDEKYPDQSYVGKSFEIINKGKMGDKTYNTYSVVEIEPI